MCKRGSRSEIRRLPLISRLRRQLPPEGKPFFALFGELFGNGQLFVLLGVWLKGGEGLRIEIRIWSASGGSFGELAFGKANDCVKLALCEDVDIASLDLSLLTEIRKSEKGCRRDQAHGPHDKVLEQLAGMADQGDERSAAERFLEALLKGMEDGA